MKFYPFLALLLLLADARAGSNITLWDTQTKGAANPNSRSEWKAVPSDLMLLEKDPAKAASDPGYYGREYQFAGDAVVENNHFLAAFDLAGGKLVFHTKNDPQLIELQPFERGQARRVELVRNAADEVVLAVSFVSDGPRDPVATFTFGKNEIVEMSLGSKLRGLKIASAIEHAVVPGFVADDLIFSAVEDATGDSISVPAENMLLGLVKGESHVLAMTWPKGKQRVRLNLAAEKDKKRAIASIEFENAGEPVYLAILSAPGIWHREPLNSTFLEKETKLNWKRTFAAKWQTQLTEGSVKTTFPFRDSKGSVWRGVPGMYEYPVRFDGDTAVFHLSKKVPPRGEAIIYFLEGHDTPANVLTPVDMLKATLGRVAAEPILDIDGRRLRTHHGNSGSGVHRACTCGYTEAIQAIFEKGEEVDKKSLIDQSIADMIYFIEQHLARIDEYRQFSKELTAYTQNVAGKNPELKAYLEEIDQLVQQIPQEYENQKENMKSLEYAGELSKKTMALTSKKDAKNLSSFMDLLKAWRGMGGAQDYVVAQYHSLVRNLFQQAGYLAATDPKAIEVAQEIRSRCKRVLRSPDGYEIWPNF